MNKSPLNNIFYQEMSRAKDSTRNSYTGDPNRDRVQMDSTPEKSFSTNVISSGGYWVFLSNRIVGYWPFSVKRALDFGNHKYLSFQKPTLGLILSILYICLNAFYVIHYFCCKIGEDAELFQPFDLILITIWDLMVVVSVAAHRIYGMVQLSKFGLFWDEIVGVVSQITVISSQNETEHKFKLLRRWTLKWFAVFFLFGLVDCSAVIYHYTFVSEDRVLVTVMFEYLEIVICMHNSSALILIFFIKIITYGFTVCKQKLIELCTKLPYELEMITLTHQKPNHNQHVEPSVLLGKVLKLIEHLECCVDSFNKLFVFSLFLETVLSFWQVMFSMYFLHITSIDNFAFAVNMAVPIITYPVCLLILCVTASALTVECQEMIAIFQNLPVWAISQDEAYKIQIIVTRLTSNPPLIQVSQIFQIRESLLGSALNTLATYFIVLVQMRQINKST